MSRPRWPASDDASPEIALHQVAVGDDRVHAEAGLGTVHGLQDAWRRLPCRSRWRCPGRAGRWSSRRPACGRTRGGPGCGCPTGGTASARPAAGRSRSGAAASRAACSRGRPRARTGRGRARRIGRVVAQVARPDHVRHRRGAQRQAGVAGLGLLDGIQRERADGVHAELVDLIERSGHAHAPSEGGRIRLAVRRYHRSLRQTGAAHGDAVHARLRTPKGAVPMRSARRRRPGRHQDPVRGDRRPARRARDRPATPLPRTAGRRGWPTRSLRAIREALEAGRRRAKRARRASASARRARPTTRPAPSPRPST